MRSFLFGFIVPSYCQIEAELFCSLDQAYGMTEQLLRQMEGLCFDTPSYFASEETCSLGLEVWIAQEEPEVNLVISQAMLECDEANEMERLLIVKEALSWRWLKFRDEAAITQIFLSLTMDNTVHLMILTGWNEGAGDEKIASVCRFIKSYFNRMDQLGIKGKLLFRQNPESQMRKSRPYGQRLDTVVKLTKLYENREKERARGKIKTTRQAACEFVGIALSTFKKYNAILYDRWYDKEYEATI